MRIAAVNIISAIHWRALAVLWLTSLGAAAALVTLNASDAVAVAAMAAMAGVALCGVLFLLTLDVSRSVHQLQAAALAAEAEAQRIAAPPVVDLVLLEARLKASDEEAGLAPPPYGWTALERFVMTRLSEGSSSDEIAALLGLSGALIEVARLQALAKLLRASDDNPGWSPSRAT